MSKAASSGPPQRRDRLIREREHDTYKLPGKLPDPTVCPDCGALYRDGRWTWGDAPQDAQHTRCPACHRVQDRYPGGFLTLAGAFLGQHREEVLGLARNVEEREKAAHPLKRIMGIEEQGAEVLITTSASGLARNIGDALHHAYRGELEYRYVEEDDVLRVSWRR